MRRFFLITLTLSIFLFASGCAPVEKRGLDHFEKHTCSVGLTANLFPSDEFLTDFECEYGDYQYFDSDDWKWGNVNVSAYLCYSTENYENAKDYCLEKLSFCDSHQYEVQGFQFYEILCHQSMSESGDFLGGCRYPRQFNMFAYNDQTCTLLFLGYYNGEPDNEEKQLAETDFSAFLKAVYYEYYN